MWWAYFDVVALVAARRLERAAPGRERNEIARDSYSYLHYPMVAGIVLVALGLKKVIGNVGDPLKTVPAVALTGGVALYLLAHVLFRLRNVHSVNVQRLVLAGALVAFAPLATELDAIVTLAIVTLAMWGLILFEVTRFAEARHELRQHHPIAGD
jgi:low temperature requirement protein LtrA